MGVPDYRSIRKYKKLTLRKVEMDTGISNSYLSQLENGLIKKPSHETITKLNTYYDMPDKTKILIEVFDSLKELVELKKIKEEKGETDAYLNRKPLAWATAKRIVQKYKNNWWGVKA